MANFFRCLLIATSGGTAYCLLELLYRRRTHWSMFLAGALALLSAGLLDALLANAAFWLHLLAAGLAITLIEFLFGCLFNLRLGLAVWDYHKQPGALLGQVCPLSLLLWLGLSAYAIFVFRLLWAALC